MGNMLKRNSEDNKEVNFPLHMNAERLQFKAETTQELS